MKKKFFPSFWRETDGVAAVEFALVAPVLLLLTMGVIETGLMLLAQNVMENATFVSSRLGKTGFSEAGKTRQQTILDQFDGLASSLLDTNLVNITELSYDNFSNIGQPEPFVDANANGNRDNGENYTDVNGNGAYDTDMGAVGAGNAGQITVYVVTYPWTITTPLISSIIGTDGVVNLTARTVVRNEPF